MDVDDMRTEVKELLEYYEKGSRFCMANGIAGFDLSEDVNDLLKTLLEQYLEGIGYDG